MLEHEQQIKAIFEKLNHVKLNEVGSQNSRTERRMKKNILNSLSRMTVPCNNNDPHRKKNLRRRMRTEERLRQNHWKKISLVFFLQRYKIKRNNTRKYTKKDRIALMEFDVIFFYLLFLIVKVLSFVTVKKIVDETNIHPKGNFLFGKLSGKYYREERIDFGILGKDEEEMKTWHQQPTRINFQLSYIPQSCCFLSSPTNTQHIRWDERCDVKILKLQIEFNLCKTRAIDQIYANGYIRTVNVMLIKTNHRAEPECTLKVRMRETHIWTHFWVSLVKCVKYKIE